MKRLIIFTFFLLIGSRIIAQENCKVSVDLLAGTYSGECTNGKANGKGKATGVDSYEGEFKNGYPDGAGVYTSSEKKVYTGSFKKGLMDGKGELNYKLASGADTTIKGFWKKNKYVGEYEKPFEVNDRTSKVNKVEISISRKNTIGNINVTSKQLNSTAFTSLPTVTDIQVISGQYINKNISNMSNSSMLRIQQIIFPFRARFQFSNGEMVDITFYEKGDYDVNIDFL